MLNIIKIVFLLVLILILMMLFTCAITAPTAQSNTVEVGMPAAANNLTVATLQEKVCK